MHPLSPSYSLLSLDLKGAVGQKTLTEISIGTRPFWALFPILPIWNPFLICSTLLKVHSTVNFITKAKCIIEAGKAKLEWIHECKLIWLYIVEKEKNMQYSIQVKITEYRQRIGLAPSEKC